MSNGYNNIGEGTLTNNAEDLRKSVDNFNGSHSYISFAPPEPMPIDNTTSNSTFSISALNFMGQISESNTSNPVDMVKLDNNMYDLDTASYNSSLYFASMKRKEQTNIRDGKTAIVRQNGLRYVIRNKYCGTDYGFFLRTTDKLSEGFEGRKEGFEGRKEGFEGRKKENVTEGFTEGYENAKDGLTVMIVDGYMENNWNERFSYFEGKDNKLRAGTSKQLITNFTNIATATNNMMPNNNSQHHWSAQWTGYLLCDKDGTWKWQLSSDDCGYLWIDDVMVINYGGQHGKGRVDGSIPLMQSGSIDLKAGGKYKMKIQMGEYGGAYGLDLGFIRPGESNPIYDGRGLYVSALPRTGIKSVNFSQRVDGLKFAIVNGYMNNNTSYFEGKSTLSPSMQGYASDYTNLSTMTNNSVLDNNAAGVISGKWSGYFYAKKSGDYTFSLATDDCGYVIVDNEIVVKIQGWVSRGAYQSGTINLTADSYYTISYMWGNGGGPCHAEFMFAEPNSSTFIRNGAGSYFSDVPKLYTFSQSSLPQNSISKSLYGSFSPTQPTVQQNENQMLTVYPDVFTAGVNVIDFVRKTPVGNPNGEFSVEWFGYFHNTMAGNYSFTVSNPGISRYSCMVWVGDDALVTYTDKNVNLIATTGSAVTGKLFYSDTNLRLPVRILYGQLASSGSYNFNLAVNISQSSVVPQSISSDGNGCMEFLTFNSQPYEPIQMAFALRDDTYSNSKFMSCYVSPIDTANNYVNNQKLRKVKVMQNIRYDKTMITTNTSNGNANNYMQLKPDGNLVFKNSANQEISITDGTSINGTCATSCSNVGTNNAISNVSIMGNATQNTNLEGFFVITSSQKTNNTGKITYTEVSFILDMNSYNSMYRSSPPTTFTVNYLVGEVRKSKTMPANGTISVNNLDETIEIMTGAKKCVDYAANLCKFTLRLGNDGVISITTPTKLIWKSPKLPINVDELDPVLVWRQDAAVKNNYTVTSASYATPFDKTPFSTGILGTPENPYIYSPNCKFKLAVESNNIMIKYAPRILNAHSVRTSTNKDGSNSFMLIHVNADEKLGRTFVKNTATKTLVDVEISKGSFLGGGKSASSYKKSNSKYSFPPQVGDNAGVDGRSYTSYTNTNLQGCQEICNTSQDCTHLYSYKGTNGIDQCTVNKDGQPAKYYPNVTNSQISSSSLYMRDKEISSTCRYSYPKYTNTERDINIVSGNKGYNDYSNNYKILPTNTDMPSQLLPSTEGACGDKKIFGNSKLLIGPENAYTYNNYHPSTEGFSDKGSLYEGLVDRTNGVSMQSRPPIDQAKIDAEKIYIPGYQRATHCNDLSTIQGEPGYMNSCIGIIQNNIAAINDYSVQYGKNNVKIDKNYRDIADMVRDVSGLYTTVNDPTKKDIFGATKDRNNIYDPIDYSGNLVYSYGTKQSPELKDGMLDDMKNEIIQQNAMYIMGTMTVASLLIFILMISK
jgi:hypothetical protein